MLLLISYCKIHFSQRSLYDPYKPLGAQRSSLARAPLFCWQVEVGDKVCHKATPPSTDVSWLFLELSPLRQILLRAEPRVSSLKWERKGLIGDTWQADTLLEMSAEFPPYLSHCFENIFARTFCLLFGSQCSETIVLLDTSLHLLWEDWLAKPFLGEWLIIFKNKTKQTFPTGCLF